MRKACSRFCLAVLLALGVSAAPLFAGDPNDFIKWNRLELTGTVTEYEVAFTPNGINLNVSGTPIAVVTVPQPSTGDPVLLQGTLFNAQTPGQYSVQIRAKIASGHFTAWSDPVLVTWTTTVSGLVTGVVEIAN